MTFKRLIRSAAMVFALLATTLAGAQEGTREVSPVPGQQERGVSFGAPEMRMTLDEAVALALEHNIDLEVSRLNLAALSEGILATTGIFDPVLSANLQEQYSEQAATNQLVGADVNIAKRRTFNLSLDTLLPLGTQTTIEWTNFRSETNSTFYYLNPSYSASFGFSISQPLLRGFGTDVNRSNIEVARRTRDISQLQFEQIVIQTLRQVEYAYWNMVYQRDNLAVKQQSLRLAQDLLDQTRTRVRIGTSAPIDIVQSEATVAAREQEIIVAENQVADAADVIKGLMGFETTEDWNSVIIPVDTLEVTPETPSLDASIDEGLRNRIELKQEALREEIARINMLSANNSVRPQLNLIGGYGYGGVGGTFIDRDNQGNIIETVPGGWEDALKQIKNGDFPQWYVGLTFGYPLGNNAAKAQRLRRRFELDAQRETNAVLQQQVISEVRNTVRGLQAAAKSIAASIKARELAERNLDAEQKKFANGMSTNYQVLQIQEDLAAAQAAELSSQVAYRAAKVAYHVAVGTLFETVGVRLAAPPEREEPHSYWKDVNWMKFGHYSDGLDTGDNGGDDAKQETEASEEGETQ